MEPAPVVGRTSLTAAEILSGLPTPPEPFQWTDELQLCVKHEITKGGKKEDAPPILVCDKPIYLDTVQTAELDRGTYSYKFKKLLPQEGWQDVHIEAAQLHGAAGIAQMFGKGVVVHDPRLFLQFVRAQVDNYHNLHRTETRFDQYGWKHDDSSFLFGEMLYTSAGPVTAIGGKEVTARNQYLGPKPKGSLQAWSEAADSLFASDMEAISATVLASFAAPLMKFQSDVEGGAILHLYTPSSGQGKTTALMGAWTVWGQREGLSLTNEDTKVAKPIALGTLANLPVIYDELRNKDPEQIRQLVVMFTEGRDRLRGQIDGTLRHQKSTWQTVLLSAANNPLVDQLQSDGTDAPAFRVLELNAQLPKTVDKTHGDRLRKVLADNAGHAGDAYLRYLMQPDVLAWTKQALDQWTREIWQRTGSNPAQRFRIRLIGAIAVAGALLKGIDLLHFQSERIVNWLVDQVKHDSAMVSLSSITDVEPATVAINALGEFINAHKGEALAVMDRFRGKNSSPPVMQPSNRLSIRYEINPAKVYIATNVFRAWALERQMSPRTIIEQLMKAGVVLDYRRGVTLGAGTNIPGLQVACMEVDAAHPAVSGLVAAVETLQIQASAKP